MYKQVRRDDYFNSIKVQLRQKACIEAADDFKFQFHKGTIKTF